MSSAYELNGTLPPAYSGQTLWQTAEATAINQTIQWTPPYKLRPSGKTSSGPVTGRPMSTHRSALLLSDHTGGSCWPSRIVGRLCSVSVPACVRFMLKLGHMYSLFTNSSQGKCAVTDLDTIMGWLYHLMLCRSEKKVSILFIFKNRGTAVMCSIALRVLCSFICCSATASKTSISEFQELGFSGDVPNVPCSFRVHLLRIMQIDWLSQFRVLAPIVSAQYATSSPKQNVQPVTFSLHGFLDSIKL